MYKYGYFYLNQVGLESKSNVTTNPKSGASCGRSQGKLLQSIFNGRITVNTMKNSFSNKIYL